MFYTVLCTLFNPLQWADEIVDCWQSVFVSKFRRGYEGRRFTFTEKSGCQHNELSERTVAKCNGCNEHLNQVSI